MLIPSLLGALAISGFGGATPYSQRLPECPNTMKIRGILYQKFSNGSAAYACGSEGAVQRFEVQSGDRGYWADYMHGNERSELVTDFTAGQPQLLYPSGADAWVSFDLMVQASDPRMSWAILGQFHPVADAWDAAVPPSVDLALRFQHGTYTLSLETRSDSDLVSKSKPLPVPRWSSPISVGTWYHMAIRVRADPLGQGQLEFWLNGTRQVSYSALPIGYNNRTDGNYWQYGIYRGASPYPLTVVYRDMQQGSAPLK